MKNSLTGLLRRKDLWLLASLILITLAVRLPGVFNRAIWYDEAITLLETAGNAIPVWSESPVPAHTQRALLVGSPSFRAISAGLRETDVHPPVYYLLLSKWRRLAGGSIEAARLFSVFWSTMAVVLLFLLLRLSGYRSAFLTGLVYSLSSGAVHYAHEARNYALTQFFILLAMFLAYMATKIALNNRLNFKIFSIMMAAVCGLAFQTNYLAIFPVASLLLWYLIWVPKEQRAWAILPVIIAAAFSLAWLGAFVNQLGARPSQFQKALGFGQELLKIIQFNFTILWNPVISNNGVQLAVGATVVVLLVISFLYSRSAWKAIDARLFTMMAGLAVAPSAGLLVLDLIFSKDLGKASYVLFAGPPIVFLLTMAAGQPREDDTEGSSLKAARLARAFRWVLPLFVGLQLTGINFNRERTPGFAGSTLRSLAARIEASSPVPAVVIGAGHGRGDPASVIYELDGATIVCVVNGETDIVKLESELSAYDEIWMIFAKGRKTAAVEEELLRSLTDDGEYLTLRATKRIGRLRRKPASERIP